MADRQGSYTVFVALVFTAFLIGIGAFISAAGKTAVSSVAANAGRLWGTSILAEYDLNLKDRYGLFAYYGSESVVKEKLTGYASYSFKDKEYISYSISDCSLDDYGLWEQKNFKSQVEDAALYHVNPLPLERNEGAEYSSSDTYGSREISSKWILESLPSAGLKESVSTGKIIGEINKGVGITELMGNSLVNSYIFTYFKDNLNERELGETYFKNEIEYIISGKKSDSEALKNVKSKLIAVRNALNLVYLYSSPEKCDATMTVASVMTPGAEAVATQAVLMETWAYAEAQNDIRRLFDGNKVSLIKSDASWALTLDNALNFQEIMDSGYITPSDTEGYVYDQYLRIMINFVPEEAKLLRIMDLIQINMKYLYCDYFLISDYYTGVNFSMKVNGVSHEFEESYEREEQ